MLHLMFAMVWVGQDRSVCRIEQRGRRARMLRVRGLIRPTQGVCTTADAARGEKRLLNSHNAGELALKQQSTWGMPD
jgi:hypothetical protein